MCKQGCPKFTQLLGHSICMVGCSQRETQGVLSELLELTCFSYALPQVLVFTWLTGLRSPKTPLVQAGVGWRVGAMEGKAQGPRACTVLENAELTSVLAQFHLLASVHFCTEQSLPFLCPSQDRHYPVL